VPPHVRKVVDIPDYFVKDGDESDWMARWAVTVVHVIGISDMVFVICTIEVDTVPA
jgi:hypothetical protein